ncbi:large conductance mechanosensitive channel protein MscL [Lacinutrix sp. Bg11-31]|uniref:large conductance mechanosensitive channel protein MscL n=1 Tax=Lacinutrix sp. Bg11-31 TaxID=2057808 RepID=UPI000C304D7D|nr:large conductance mechanosensitive channel protein MscL [Lacinutrix sp. Bg11-31]AUC81088.1 large conductance mechanosensitive channel protein MscL [Lacinutrix sp. Bg11-31]
MTVFFKEFKEFAVKGNMMDMAIGIIIGASFNKVIDVLVKKVLMPPLSLMTDGINLQDKKIILREGTFDEAGKVIADDVVIQYGALAEAFMDFIIIGITVFLVVKGMNRLRDKSNDTKDKTVKTPKDIQLLTDLNELMAEQNKLLKAQSKNA